jgi:hypothetical protein
VQSIILDFYLLDGTLHDPAEKFIVNLFSRHGMRLGTSTSKFNLARWYTTSDTSNSGIIHTTTKREIGINETDNEMDINGSLKFSEVLVESHHCPRPVSAWRPCCRLSLY